MNEFKTMQFVRDARDSINKDTKNKTKEEIHNYYKTKASWINSFLKKELKSKSRP